MINWVDNLINEYECGKDVLIKQKNTLGNNDLDKQDKSQINSMINDMSFAIDWMTEGREPGKRRGADKKGAYHKRVILDMDLFPSLDIQPKEKELSEKEKEAIVDVLAVLSHRERQCFLLHKAYMMSMTEIEKELGIKKPTIQKYIERAKIKINNKISCHTNVI